MFPGRGGFGQGRSAGAIRATVGVELCQAAGARRPPFHHEPVNDDEKPGWLLSTKPAASRQSTQEGRAPWKFQSFAYDGLVSTVKPSARLLGAHHGPQPGPRFPSSPRCYRSGGRRRRLAPPPSTTSASTPRDCSAVPAPRRRWLTRRAWSPRGNGLAPGPGADSGRPHSGGRPLGLGIDILFVEPGTASARRNWPAACRNLPGETPG